ncbi:MAG: hypothetical protein BYD32DRAFT_457427 [Podila humilis]|nr:MAG: hypothetical protein BYD32DRAFT_457427 [Podila humilis]
MLWHNVDIRHFRSFSSRTTTQERPQIPISNSTIRQNGHTIRNLYYQDHVSDVRPGLLPPHYLHAAIAGVKMLNTVALLLIQEPHTTKKLRLEPCFLGIWKQGVQTRDLEWMFWHWPQLERVSGPNVHQKLGSQALGKDRLGSWLSKRFILWSYGDAPNSATYVVGLGSHQEVEMVVVDQHVDLDVDIKRTL